MFQHGVYVRDAPWNIGICEQNRRHLEVDAYAGDVQDGVVRIHEAGADVILLDLQFIPDSLGLSDPGAYRQALRDAARTDDTALFPRFDLMQFWAKSGLIDLNARDSGRRVQSARTLFACLGEALGTVIAASLR